MCDSSTLWSDRWITAYEGDGTAELLSGYVTKACDHKRGVCQGEQAKETRDEFDATHFRLVSKWPICYRHSCKSIKVSTPDGGPVEWKLNLEKRCKEVYVTAGDPSDPEALWLRFTEPVTPRDVFRALAPPELEGPQFYVLQTSWGRDLDAAGDATTRLQGIFCLTTECKHEFAMRPGPCGCRRPVSMCVHCRCLQ